MSLEVRVRAIRYAAALTELTDVRALRFSGPDAFEAFDGLCPKELFLRDGQVMQTLLLRPDGTPFADVYLGCDGEDLLLLAEGPSEQELADYLDEHLPADLEVAREDLGRAFAQLSLDGPYAWEVLAAAFGAEVVGLPYLTLWPTASGLCARLGKTGEFGYHLLVPRGEADAFRASMRALGERFGLVEGSRQALDLCALENWFFNIRAEGRAPLTPLELQLQWRISPFKRFVGSEAVDARRERLSQRLTMVRGPGPLAAGDVVTCGHHRVGTLLNAGYSFCRGDFLGLALLDLEVAHSGVSGLSVAHDQERVPVETASPPMLRNRSLYVDPRQHCYEHRNDDVFPPVA